MLSELNMTTTTAPKEIVELVDRFNRNLDAYRSDEYNEARLRREFIDPFFRALGWDVDNESGAAEAYKDVIMRTRSKSGRRPRRRTTAFVSEAHASSFLRRRNLQSM